MSQHNLVLGGMGIVGLMVLPGMALLVGVGGIGAGLFGVVGLMAADRATATPVPARVVEHRWERAVEIEVFGPVREVVPCSVHSSLRRRTRLHDRHRSRPRRCTREVIKWHPVDELRSEGTGLRPTWPTVPNDRCEELGCRRPGARSEVLEVVIAYLGDTAACEVAPRRVWQAWPNGSSGTVQLGGLSGWAYCDTLEPAPSTTGAVAER